MRINHLLAPLAFLVALSGQTSPALAQTANGQPTARVPDMQTVAAALGVTCDYCHSGRGAAPILTATGKPRLEVGREMIAMTNDLNARVQAATGKSASDAVSIECVTCHRGVAIPRQLRDIMLQTSVQQSPAEAAKIYRDLRARYFGSQSYDFSEETLVAVADRLAQTRPNAAIALADLNLEFYPKSVRSYLVKGIAQTRRLDTTPDAVATFKKALEIEPDNGVIQGWLLQTEPLARRQR